MSSRVRILDCWECQLTAAQWADSIYKTAQDPVTAYWEHLNQCQQRFPSIFALDGREWVSAFRVLLGRLGMVSTGAVGVEQLEKALQPQRTGIGLFSWQLSISMKDKLKLLLSLMWYGGHLCICLGNSKCFNLSSDKLLLEDLLGSAGSPECLRQALTPLCGPDWPLVRCNRDVEGWLAHQEGLVGPVCT